MNGAPEVSVVFPTEHDPALAAYLTDYTELDPSSGCWLWTGLVTSGGGMQVHDHVAKAYGTRSATRLAWLATQGTEPPDGARVRHHCGQPRCVHPEHLTTSDLVKAARQQAKAQAALAAQVARDAAHAKRAEEVAAKAEARASAQAARKADAVKSAEAKVAAKAEARAARDSAQAERAREAEAKAEAKAAKLREKVRQRAEKPHSTREVYRVPGEVIREVDGTCIRLRGSLKVGPRLSFDPREVYAMQNIRDCVPLGQSGRIRGHVILGISPEIMDAVRRAPRAVRHILPNGHVVFELPIGATVPLEWERANLLADGEEAMFAEGDSYELAA